MHWGDVMNGSVPCPSGWWNAARWSLNATFKNCTAACWETRLPGPASQSRLTRWHTLKTPSQTRSISPAEAYEARARFAVEGPAWAQMLPIGEECYPLQKATGAMHVLGCYAFSLQLMSHDYLRHPKFYRFACGMMAHPDAP